MRFFHFLITTFLLVNTYGQQQDSLKKNKIQSIDEEIDSLKAAIDSLKTLVDSLNQRINYIEKYTGEQNPFDSLLTIIGTEKDTTIIPEDQRSRRKQLDDLLEYISKKPGQLFFNGQTNAIVQGNLQKDDRFSTGEGSINLFASSSFGEEHNFIY